MSQIYIMTVPRTVHKKVLKIMIAENDVKRWVIGWETGSGGYEHYQIRLETSNPQFFYWVKLNMPTAHVEQSKIWTDYEKKEGRYICSDDNKKILAVRYATLRPMQRKILQTVNTQSDREIDVWLDPGGNHGKSFLSIHLYERGVGLVVPRYCFTSRGISQYLCSAYNGQKYIIFDVPRAGKIPPDIYEAIEAAKDGLVHDERYSGKARNIRGAKIIVFTNKPLDTKKLSKDRWRLHGIDGGESLS